MAILVSQPGEKVQEDKKFIKRGSKKKKKKNSRWPVTGMVMTIYRFLSSLPVAVGRLNVYYRNMY
jgi:hypothetical protein